MTMKLKPLTALLKVTFFRTVTITFLSLSIQSPLFAGVYKWVDDNGQIHYGERPGNTGAERMTIQKTQTNKPKPDVTTKDDTEIKKGEVSETGETDEVNKDDKDAEKKPMKAEKPTISKKEKRRLCKEGREDYKKISSRGRVREVNKKGEYSYLSEKQRQKRLSSAKKKQRKYCN